MAKELSIEPDEFNVDVQWPSAPEAGGNKLLDSSVVRFEMKAGETALTAYQTDAGLNNTYLTVPAYYLGCRQECGGNWRSTGSENLNIACQAARSIG
jgi:hypothetical protein